MFKQLRNRFLFVNLVIISVMMLLAFASIYTITYQNVHHDIDMELHKISDFYRKHDGNPRPPRSNGDHQQPPADKKMPPWSERSVSFLILTDKHRNITSITSRFEMDREFYNLAIDEALSQNKGIGQVNLDGNHWAFTVQQTDKGNNLVFLDITAQQGILTHLVYTFFVVGSVMLIVIFFISRFFADRSIAPVKEAFEKQKQFIADASHELKTPLAIIHTNADVLLANGEDTIQKQSKWLHYIKSETERMTKLTNDLLYLTEMEDARARMIFTEFNVSEVVENVMLTMEAVIFEKHLAFDYEIEPDLTTCGNSEQIKQVILILLDNAIKYTNPQGSINIKLKKQHNVILFSIANTGKGISSEHMERIFDRFYRTDPSRARKYGGYGLGLAIAKAIIDQHQGKIYVKSEVNEKTMFYVQLPL